MFKKTLFLFIALVSLFHAGASSVIPIDTGEQKIRLNQIGFYPGAQKIAIVISLQSDRFAIQELDGHTVFRGKLVLSLKPGLNGGYSKVADFSNFKRY